MQNTVSASDLYQINNRSWDRSLIVFEKKGGSGNYSLTRFILCEKIRNEDLKPPASDTKPKDPFSKERVFDFIVIYLYYITSLHQSLDGTK